MSNFFSSKPIVVKGLRATWLDIFQPGDGIDGGAPKFKFAGIFSPGSEAEAQLKAAMLEAARGHWKENAVNVIRSMAANSKAIRNGNDKLNDDGSVREEYKDMLWLSASAKTDQRPLIVTQKRLDGKWVVIGEDGRGYCEGKDVTDDLDYEIVKPYRGCYVNVKVQMVAGKQFTGNDKKVIPNQVFARFEAVQFAKHGQAFGAGPGSADGFDDEEIEAGGGKKDDDGLGLDDADDDIAF